MEQQVHGYVLKDFTLLYSFSSRQSASFVLFLSVLLKRESEAHLEREVRVGPLVCWDPRVVQVHQDQMGSRYDGNYHHGGVKNHSKCFYI